MIELPIYLVDDDESVRDSLAFLLSELELNVTMFADGSTFLQQVDITHPGCVILDSRMPVMRGQQIHQQLIELHSPLGIVYLTGHGDVPMAVDALKQGAVDFLQKPVDVDKLISAITKAAQYSEVAAKSSQIQRAYNSLTEREKLILSLLVQGLKNQQIADKLCIAVRTAEVHRASLMKKFSAKTIAELVMQYAQIN